MRQAHRTLQPDTMRRKRRKRGKRRDRRKRTKRQGEWFFVPVDDAEVLERIAEIVELAGRERRAPVPSWAGGSARPHLVDERARVGEAITCAAVSVTRTITCTS